MNLQFFGGRGAKSGKKTSAPTIRTGALNDEEIEKLEALGGQRVIVDDQDLIYFRAEPLGLKVERYKCFGKIKRAEMDGEKISNTCAEVLARLVFGVVDVKTGKIYHFDKHNTGFKDYSKFLLKNFDEIVKIARRK